MSIGSSTPPTRGSTGGPGRATARDDPALHALRLPERPGGAWWERPGVSPRGERVLDVVGVAIVVLFAVGWTYSIANARALGVPGGELGITPGGAAIASALSDSRAPTAAYLTGAALTALADRMFASHRGISGKLYVRLDTVPRPLRPDTLPSGARLGYAPAAPGARAPAPAAAPLGPGIWQLVLTIGNAIRPIPNFHLITEVPFSAKKNGHIGLYYLGSWPAEKGARLKTPAYANPAGFIQVTPQNADTYVSEHFRLRDFLTHDQADVWPKYIVLSPKLLDKLELVLADLQQRGIDPKGVHVLSGFRTPQYNVHGGDPTGRAAASRHMYGDAADIYIDDDGNGVMDDLNHDGRVDINDSRVILAAVERVEAAHPELVGGAGVYVAAPGHGPFIHIDTRGFRARWVGTGGG